MISVSAIVMMVVYMILSYVLYASAKNKQVFSFTALTSTPSPTSTNNNSIVKDLPLSPQFYGNPYVDSLQHSRYIDLADDGVTLIDAYIAYSDWDTYGLMSSSQVRCAYPGTMQTANTLNYILASSLVTGAGAADPGEAGGTAAIPSATTQIVYWHFAPSQVQICTPFAPNLFRDSLIYDSTYLTQMENPIVRVCKLDTTGGLTANAPNRFFQLSTQPELSPQCTTPSSITLTYAGSYPVVRGHIYKAEFHPVLRFFALNSSILDVAATVQKGDKERLPPLTTAEDHLRRMGVYGTETIWKETSPEAPYPTTPLAIQAADKDESIKLPYDELLFVEILQDNLMVPVWSASCDGDTSAEDPPLLQCFPPSTWLRGRDYRFVRLDELSFRTTYYYQGGEDDSTTGRPYSDLPSPSFYTYTPYTTSSSPSTIAAVSGGGGPRPFVNMTTTAELPSGSQPFVDLLGPWIYVVSDSDPTMVPHMLLAKGLRCIPLIVSTVKDSTATTLQAERSGHFGALMPYNMGVMLPPDFHSAYNHRCITAPTEMKTKDSKSLDETRYSPNGVFYLSPVVPDTYNYGDILHMQSTYATLNTGYTASMVLVTIGMLVVVIGGAIAYFKDNHNWLREGENPIDALERAASAMWKNANESSLLQFLVPTKILLAFVLMIVLYQAFEATDMPYMVLCLMLPLMSSFFIVSMQYNDQADALKTSARSNLFATLLTVVVLCTLLSSMLSNASSTMRTTLTTVIIAATLYYCFIAQWYESQMHEVNDEEFFG